jgi:hypothetical protein
MNNIMQTTKLLTSTLFLALTAFTPMDNSLTVKDYLSLPESLTFNSTAFKLAWSSHPNEGYYMQEYLPKGETLERFNRMMIVSAIVGDVELKVAVDAKVEELNQRKATDQTVNFEISRNPTTGEYLLDFIVSASENGKTTITEWNVYRYMNLKEKSGSEGILLVAYSRRAYGDDIDSFLRSLKSERPNDIKAMADFTVPRIKLAK